MPPEDQNFKVYLSFKDDATGKFIKASNAQINSMKKLGVTIKKEGAGAQIALNKVGLAHEKAGHKARFQNREIGKLAGSIGSLRNMILVWMFALRPMIALFKSSTEAMMRQEDAIKRLNFAMEIQGTYSKFMEGDLKKLSAAFQEVTRYGDEAIMEVFEKLITVGKLMPSQLERATQAVVDLAAGTGRSLSESAELVAKGAVGYTMQIARTFGVTIPKTISVAKQFQMVLKLIEGQMSGRAQRDIESYAGKVAQMANAWSDAKESLGFFLVKTLHLTAATVRIKKFFDTLSGKNIVTELDKVNQQLKTLEEIAIKFSGKKPMKLLWFIPIGELDFGEPFEKAADLAARNALLIRRTQLQVQEFLDLQRANELGKVIKAGQDKLAIQRQFADRYSIFQLTQADFRLEALEKEYDTYKSAFEDSAKEMLEIEKWYQFELTKLRKLSLQQEKDQYNASEIFMKSYATNMSKTMSEGFFKIITKDFEGLKDVVVSFGEIMLKTILEIIVKLILMTMWKKAAGFLGFPGEITGHTGGYALNLENSFGYRKKFHSGGEVSATLLEGEGVLNRIGMRSLGVNNLNKLNRGEGAGGGQVINNYYINAIDTKSFRDRLQEHGDIYANASEMGIRDNTSLRGTSQKWG